MKSLPQYNLAPVTTIQRLALLQRHSQRLQSDRAIEKHGVIARYLDDLRRQGAVRAGSGPRVFWAEPPDPQVAVYG